MTRFAHKVEGYADVSLHDAELAEALDAEHDTAGSAGGTAVEQPGRARATRFAAADAWIMLAYVAFSFLLFSRLWVNLHSGYLWNSASDQNLWEWFFDVTAHNVAHLQNPLTSDLQDHPLGVNLMANTAMLGIGIPLAPVTLLFGPTATWAVALTGGVAGTAIAWYWVFSRHLVTHRAGAAIGGAVAGFAPSMISHANAHPNFVAWFVLPFIALRVIRLARGTRPVRDGTVLGLLVAYQVYLGEEPMLIAAVAFAVFAIVYLVSRPREIGPMLRPLLIGLPIAAVLALLLTAYPLWYQFFGPQSYQRLEHGQAANDTAAMTRFATQSVAGDPAAAADVSMNRTEENAFFGWPLIVLMVVVTIWLWKDVVARAMAVSMFIMAWLSLGSPIMADHRPTWFPGPWRWLAHLPLFESVLESRLAMGCVPLIGGLLAIATGRVFAASGAFAERGLPVRLVWLGAVAAVLLPIAPTRLIVHDRPATAAFFTDGTWRQYVDPGGTLVTVPLPGSGMSEPLHWQMDAGLGFAMPEGYFVGPSGPTDKRGRYGATSRPTSDLLWNVKQSGTTVGVTDAMRDQAIADLRYWDADVVVLVPGTNEQALQSTVELLLRRPARLVDGVFLWDVRDLTGSS